MNIPGKRILLGTAVAVAALGVGGIAYAAGNDPAPDQGYVTVEEGTPSAAQGDNPSTGTPQQGSGTAEQGSGTGTRDGRDCPDKQGGGQGQGQAQPTQPDQNPTQPDQNPTQPEQNPADDA
ncbi:hypothetical protein ACFTSF_34370 [Kribbella sp. NPDC056951]|uniref:hypothetical protein n=1 Tax=Kribbella sp. NPDC056951 TaxID=3345978 RepID=UPI00363A92C9